MRKTYCYSCTVHGLETVATTTAMAVYGDESGGLYQSPDETHPACESCASVARSYPVRSSDGAL